MKEVMRWFRSPTILLVWKRCLDDMSTSLDISHSWIVLSAKHQHCDTDLICECSYYDSLEIGLDSKSKVSTWSVRSGVITPFQEKDSFHLRS